MANIWRPFESSEQRPIWRPFDESFKLWRPFSCLSEVTEHTNSSSNEENKENEHCSPACTLYKKHLPSEAQQIILNVYETLKNGSDLLENTKTIYLKIGLKKTCCPI
jgi:hypothetical protein